MRRTKSLIPTAAVLMLCLSSAVAVAAPKVLPQMIAQNTEGQRPHAQYWDKLMQELNLTPDQAQKIQAIRDQYKDQIAQRRQAVVQARRELQDIMVGTASEDQIREKHSQVEALEQQVREAGFDQMLAIRGVLTPEQRSQAAQIIQKRQADFRNRFRQQTSSSNSN